MTATITIEPETYGPSLPERADLDAATAATQAVLDDPEATRYDRLHAAEAEEAAFLAYRHLDPDIAERARDGRGISAEDLRPDIEPEAEIEIEL